MVESVVGSGLGLVFSFYNTSILFPLPNGSNFEIRSSVIGVLLAGVPNITDLEDPVIITLQLHIDRVGFCCVMH